MSSVTEKVARIQHEIRLITHQLTEPEKRKIAKKRKKYTKKLSKDKSKEKRIFNSLDKDNSKTKPSKMSFPHKIWELAHREDTDGFFQWSQNGQWITIEREYFEELYLRNPYQQHDKSPIATENWPSFVRQLNLYGFRKVQPVYARGFTGSKPESRLNRKPFSSGRSRWVNYYNPKFHRDNFCVGEQPTRGTTKLPKSAQPIEQSLEESTDIEFVKRGPVAADLNGGRRTFDWNGRRGSTESHISDISNADECPPLPPLPSMVTPDGLNHHGFMDPMLPNPSCFPYFPVGQNMESFMKTFHKMEFNDQGDPCITPGSTGLQI